MIVLLASLFLSLISPQSSSATWTIEDLIYEIPEFEETLAILISKLPIEEKLLNEIKLSARNQWGSDDPEVIYQFLSNDAVPGVPKSYINYRDNLARVNSSILWLKNQISVYQIEIPIMKAELERLKMAAVLPTPTPTPTPAPALCSREGVTIYLASQRYICVDVDGLLKFLPQIEGERLLLIKKEKIRVLNKTSELIYLLKSASKENLRNETRILVSDAISEISQYESKYRDSKITQFDYISADNEVQILEIKVASIMTISSSQKVTISCKKGKLVKKVTKVKPKCPTGYKKA